MDSTVTPWRDRAPTGDSAEAPLPDRIGPYPIEGELGRGGMGIVYLARDPRLQRPIAIKLLPEAVASDRHRVARFEQEARLLATLNHPHIATIHSLEEADGRHFITMEVIPGGTLAERIVTGDLTLQVTLVVCAQIAWALEAAHQKGVIHRDLKPRNVIVSADDAAKVLDFGLAKALGRATDKDSLSDLTSTGGVVGTPRYMSPEQLAGRQVDQRTDIWSFGCILYECLSGRLAFPVPDMDALPPETPPALRELLGRCLRVDRDERLTHIGDARRTIEETLARLDEQADPLRPRPARVERDPAGTPASVATGATTSAMTSGTEVQPPTNLPLQITSFIGRERELGAIADRVESTRLITLTGVGGSGKTRLSIEVAERIATQHPDGVWFVELAPLSNPSLLPHTVVTTLGLREEPNRTLVETLSRHLRRKSLLLVLDNCEHLLAACSQLVETLLRRCPGLRILATSREPLGIQGENTFHVPSLDVPAAADLDSIETLATVESVRLLVERARATRHDFTLTAVNANAVAEICRHLDGIPLAIELAATRARSMSIREIASRLDDRFRLLTAGSRTALPRHQTLRALIDWSYEQLTVAEQTFLRRLSVFAGGWTLDGVEAICAGDGIEKSEVLDLLSRLVDKSLVEVDASESEQAGETARYRMLETVREYTRMRLVEAAEDQVARRRHRDFFLGLAEESRSHWSGTEQSLWLARLEAEHDNLRVAIQEDQDHDSDSRCGLRLIGLLSYYWEVHGHWSEGRKLCSTLLARTDAGPRDRDRGDVLNCAATLAWHQGDYDQSRRYHEENLAIRTALGDQHGIATAYQGLGNVAKSRGEYTLARAHHERSLEIRRRIDDRTGIATSLNNIGVIANSQGDYEGARTYFLESLEIRHALGDKRGIASSLHNVASVAKDQGDYDTARSLHEQSLALRRDLADKRGIAASLNNLGLVAEDLGDYELASSYYTKSLAMRRELQDRRGIAALLHNLATVAHDQGDEENARELQEEALEIRQDLGDRRGIGASLLHLGDVALSQGDYPRAETHVRQSLELFQDLGDRYFITAALESSALLAARRGRLRRAARLFGAARAQHEAMGIPLPPGESRALAAEEERLRSALGNEEFQLAQAAGRQPALADVIAEVLEDIERPPASRQAD